MSLTDREQASLAGILRRLGRDCHMPKIADPCVDPRVDPDIVNSLCMIVDDLQLSVPALNGLQILNVKYIHELVTKSKADLRRVRRVGNATVKEIERRLEELGLHLNMPADNPNVAAARSHSPRVQ